MNNRNSTHALLAGSGLAAILTATLLLTGCTSLGEHPDASPTLAGPVFQHIHELQPNGDTVLVATHEGLYRLKISTNGDATATGPVAGLDFDPMGFAIANDVAFASGHPGPTTPNEFGAPNLGLITSTDFGETWTNVSLTGLTDFHGLTVTSGVGAPRVFGIDPSKERLQRSMDGGQTWSDGAPLVARDILAVGDLLYATTEGGLAISADDGMSFAVDTTAPALYLIAADKSGTLAGVDTAGDIWKRASGKEWTKGGPVTGTTQAFAVDGDRIYVADDRGISLTNDAGATWTVLKVHS
jgi:hypothetical protein